MEGPSRSTRWQTRICSCDTFPTLKKWASGGDGEARWDISITVSPIRDGAGLVVGAASLAHDISNRLRTQELLRKSEEQFRTAFEDAPLGMCLTGLDGRFLQVNSALCQMFGYSERELLDGAWQKLTHPDDLARSKDAAAKVADGRCRNLSIEKRYLHKIWKCCLGPPQYFGGAR